MALLQPTKSSPTDIACSAYGLLAWSGDPMFYGNASTPSTQVGYVVSIPLRAGQVVSNLHIGIATAAAGTTPTTIKLALASSDGTRRAVTANVASDSKWTSRGFVGFAVASPYTVTDSGMYGICFLQDGTWGTTALQLARSISPLASGQAVNSIYPYGSFGTGKTDIAASLTFTDANAITYWCGVS